MRVATTTRWARMGRDIGRWLRREAARAHRWARSAQFLLAPHALGGLLSQPPASGNRAYSRWVLELESEVAFWRRWIANTPSAALEERRARLDPSTPLQDWVRDLLGTPPGGTVRLLDVGAGPATQLGKVWPERTVEITALDPLADHYNRLLRTHGMQAPVPSQPGHGEQLDRLVPPQTFDLAYAVNALDHSYDPLAVIAGMLRATKADGWLALDHYVDEAEYEGYAGLHQWNFCADDGRFVIWNKERRIVINDALPRVAEFVTTRVPGQQPGEKVWLMVRIRKAHIPDEPDASKLETGS
jgi:SAM-dependent methyltransferase